jgi:uncharacterized protein
VENDSIVFRLTQANFTTKMIRMPYLVDGHNLIPKIPGLKLTDLDDEDRLVTLLQAYCRLQRKQVEVFFDGAPPGTAGRRAYGLLTAHFVRQGTTADAAIRRRLGQLQRSARNWTVVSSDQAVQREARSRQADCLSSESFALILARALEGGDHAGSEDIGASAAGEVDEWLRLFGGDTPEGR